MLAAVRSKRYGSEDPLPNAAENARLSVVGERTGSLNEDSDPGSEGLDEVSPLHDQDHEQALALLALRVCQLAQGQRNA